MKPATNNFMWCIVVVLGASTLYFAFSYMKYLSSETDHTVLSFRLHSSGSSRYDLEPSESSRFARRRFGRRNASQLRIVWNKRREEKKMNNNKFQESGTLDIFVEDEFDEFEDLNGLEIQSGEAPINITGRAGLEPSFLKGWLSPRERLGNGVADIYCGMMIRSREYIPTTYTDEELANIFGINQYVLSYKVQSLVVPVYREITTVVELNETLNENDENVLRHYVRGDYILGYSTVFGKHSSWLQTGENEYVPIYSKINGRKGIIVHMKLESKLTPEKVFNLRAYDLYRDCALFRDFNYRTSCRKNSMVTAEAIRLMSEKPNMLKPVPVEDDLPELPVETTSFEERLRALYEPLSEARLCDVQHQWNDCTLISFCSWVFSIKLDRNVCVHDKLVKENKEVPENMKIEIKREYEFKDDRNDGKKYFIYQPSGGFNNQRIQLELALTISMLTNRTCVIPHAAQHSNYYFRYNMMSTKKTVSMQQVFDFDSLREIVDVVSVPNDKSLIEWIESIGGLPYIGEPTPTKTAIVESDWRVIMRDSRTFHSQFKWHETQIKNFFRKDKTRFLFFANHTMWGAIDFSLYTEEVKLVKKHLQYTKPLKEIAIKIADSMGLYNALHIRRGDKKSEGTFSKIGKPATWYAEKMLPYQENTKKIYIASDENRMDFFEPIQEQGFDVVRWQDLQDKKLLLTFLGQFPRVMFLDMLGIVEQLLCVYAERFLGSYYSTFTLYILRMKRLLPYIGGIVDKQTNKTTLPKKFQNVNLDPEVYESKCNPYKPSSHTVPC